MKSFTLIEIIFVIVLIGLISIGAINSIPDNTLQNNTNFIYNKILEKKANALSFMANPSDSEENRTICIKFDANWIKNDEKYSEVKFNLSNRITITHTSGIEAVCFDYLGRPYKNNINLQNFNNLLYKNVDIKISYKDSDKNITIYPMSGYVEIK